MKRNKSVSIKIKMSELKEFLKQEPVKKITEEKAQHVTTDTVEMKQMTIKPDEVLNFLTYEKFKKILSKSEIHTFDYDWFANVNKYSSFLDQSMDVKYFL